MIRTLAMIALAGFILSIASFSAAVAIGGPEAVMDAAWSRHLGWSSYDGWGWGWRDRHHHGRRDFVRAEGPDGSRTITWDGSDKLELELPADVTYSQEPGPGRLVITGPANVINDIELDGGRLHLDGPHLTFGQIKVTMTAPDVRRFSVSGSGRLDIADYRQDSLDVDVAGSGVVSASGQAKSVNVDISGSGGADLGKVAAETAEVEISGSGTAAVAPTKRARLDISGSGGVDLKSRPDQLESDITGSGTVHQEGGPTLTRRTGGDS